jgi:hypothetical protein
MISEKNGIPLPNSGSAMGKNPKAFRHRSLLSEKESG